MYSNSLTLGAGESEVGKVDFVIKQTSITLSVEFEAWLEPKTLSASELRALMQRFGDSKSTGETIGTSEAFVRQNAQKS